MNVRSQELKHIPVNTTSNDFGAFVRNRHFQLLFSEGHNK